MQKAVEEANELIKDGRMTSEQAMSIQNYANKINENYQRVLYCRHLLQLPPKFIQNIRKKKEQEQIKKFMEKLADQQSVVNENQEALDNIEEITNGRECTNTRE